MLFKNMYLQIIFRSCLYSDSVEAEAFLFRALEYVHSPNISQFPYMPF